MKRNVNVFMNLLLNTNDAEVTIYENKSNTKDGSLKTFPIATKKISLNSEEIINALSELPKKYDLKINNFSTVINEEIDGLNVKFERHIFKNQKELNAFMNDTNVVNTTVNKTLIKSVNIDNKIKSYIRVIRIFNDDLNELITSINKNSELKLETILLLNETLNITYASDGALEEGVLILNIGLSNSTITFYKKKINIYHKSLNLNINNLLQTIKKTFNVTLYDAKMILNQYNQLNTISIMNTYSIGQGFKKIDPSILKAIVDDFIKQIKNAVNLNIPKHKIGSVQTLLVGEITKIKDLVIENDTANIYIKETNNESKFRLVELIGNGVFKMTETEDIQIVNESQTNKIELNKKSSIFRRFLLRIRNIKGDTHYAR